jgi:hypothetical protein
MLLPELRRVIGFPQLGETFEKEPPSWNAVWRTKSIRADSGYGKVASLIRRFKAA